MKQKLIIYIIDQTSLIGMSIVTQGHHSPPSQGKFDRAIHSTCQVVGTKAVASAHLSPADCNPNACKRCVELEHKIQELELKIKKLTSDGQAEANNSSIINSTPNGKGSQKGSPNRKFSPKHLRYSFDQNDAILESQEKKLLEIEEKAEKLCCKERKERQIIKQLSQSIHNSITKLDDSKDHKQLLSKSEISPVKPKPIKHMKLSKTDSLVIDAFNPIFEGSETQKGIPNILEEEEKINKEKIQAKVLGIPGPHIIDEILKRENGRQSNLENPVLTYENIESLLNDQKMDEQKTEPANDTVSQSRMSQNMTSRRSQQETQEAYKDHMRSSKLMAKFKRKKQK